MIAVFAVLTIGSSLCLAADPGGAGAPAAPNVVLLIADDMGYRDFGFMGHAQIRTPRIDRLAAQSLTFRRGYVTSSLCSPSLASILTGRYPHQHKITSNDPPLPRGVPAAAAARHPAFLKARRELIAQFDDQPSLPRSLARSGYVSLQTGKWWGGEFTRGGFTHGMTHGDPDRGARHGDDGLSIGRRGMKPIFDFIRTAQERRAPVFVWYAPMMPHSPHNPPERLLARYREKAPTLEIARYWAMCEWFDETCGQLLDFLDDQKLADNTLVIFLADNGWIQDPDADRYAPRSKQSPYNGGLRTPILLRWPARIAPRSSDDLASAIDIAPTVLKAAGLEPGSDLQGINLLDRDGLASRPAIFGEIFTHNAVDIHDPASSLRYRWAISGDWKLIVPDHRTEPEAIAELFNLARDPDEKENFAAENPQKVAELKARIEAWWPAGKH